MTWPLEVASGLLVRDVMELVSKLEDNDMAEGWWLCLETVAEVRKV
jgi:hypothetical protein